MVHREADFEMAQRHVREGRERIARQLEIIRKLRSRGSPTHEAELLLANFEDLQWRHEAHLARLHCAG